MPPISQVRLRLPTTLAVAPVSNRNLIGDHLVTVGAVSCTGMRSSFSNYGTWVDFSAPGGDFNGKGIYSTFPNNRYGNKNGTSMACPHVTGVAALVVSKFGDGTLTPGQVKERLMTTSRNINSLQAGYPYFNNVGEGLLDAYYALCDTPSSKPACPKDFSVKYDRNDNFLFSWTIPADGNGNPVAKCAIYIGNNKLPIPR